LKQQFVTIPKSAYENLAKPHNSIMDAMEQARQDAPVDGPFIVCEVKIHARVYRDPLYIHVEEV